ncbi:biotin transporter BioY [Streptococcus didelphis]|uniref:Biotin transporter n=1 Tax=Streptococcus didelphis TaxID=102886 RepID=A0ABY9LFQ1_9STRE|nr:biotin transporter BioY [Streptococcus didelphis]WMB27727.1 biotin transporter BioY [Streptococcus didelphis]WMB29812.1 biotin transporter BioY [Streptococcus didelphis]
MFSTKNVTYIAIMTSLIIILGMIPAIPLGFIPVPIVLQNLAIMLAALILGGKKGSLSILLFLVIGLFLPVFSASKTTLSVMMGPTAGYIVAWLFTPLLFSFLYQNSKKRQNKFLIFALIWIAGVLWVDLLGAIWLASYTGMPLLSALASNLVFIPGDTIKALIATIIALKLKESYIHKGH